MRRILIALAVLSPLAGCAAGGAPQTRMTARNEAAGHGLYVALRSCAGCHAVGSLGDSPDSRAPSFAIIRLRYDESGLERMLATITRKGHFEMPPVPLTGTEIREVTAYIQTIGPHEAAPPPRPAGFEPRTAGDRRGPKPG